MSSVSSVFSFYYKNSKYLHFFIVLTLGKGWENHVEGQKLKSDGDSFRLK